MKNAKIKLKELTIEQMFNRPEQSYNPTAWMEWIQRLKSNTQDLKFYVAEKDELYGYSRFYISHKLPEGLLIFKESDAYITTMTNAGWCQVFIIDGEVFYDGFLGDDKTRIKNVPEGRKWLVENVCSKGIFVSTNF